MIPSFQQIQQQVIDGYRDNSPEIGNELDDASSHGGLDSLAFSPMRPSSRRQRNPQSPVVQRIAPSRRSVPSDAGSDAGRLPMSSSTVSPSTVPSNLSAGLSESALHLRGSHSVTSAHQDAAHYRPLVNSLCEQYDLTQGGRVYLTHLSTLDIKALLLNAEARHVKFEERQDEEKTDFAKLNWYKRKVVPKLKAFMMSTDLQAYLKGIAAYVTSDIMEHPANWDVPLYVVRDAAKFSDFSSVVSDTLTNWRSKTKSKIKDSFEKRETIYTLTRKIAGSNITLNERHYERVAVLRSSYSDFVRREEQAPSDDKRDFWKAVDEGLYTLRSGREHPNIQREVLYGATLKSILLYDLAAFPLSGKDKTPVNKAPTRWQTDMESAVKGFVYHPDDLEEDDEDSASEAEAPANNFRNLNIN